MKKTLHYFLIFLFLFSFSVLSKAQSWQWGKRGGSGSQSMNNQWETVFDMTTDKGGNIYILSRVYQSSLNVDGHPVTGYGLDDLLLSSFSCDGTYRWSKIIGTTTNGDGGTAIKTDTLGGVYVSNYMFVHNYTAYIDVDTTINSTYKTLFLIKFDTAGVYKWIRMPQADTVTAYAVTNTWPTDMDVDENGNVYWFCQLTPGAYAGGAYVANAQGDYILKYNSQGTFQGGTQVAMNASGGLSRLIRMVRNHQTGSYYFGGAAGPLIGGSIYFNNILFTHGMYIAKFNSQGQFQWVKNNTGNGSNFLGPIALDEHSNVYASGIVYSGDTFNTVPINSSSFSEPIVVSLDSNGNNRWVKWDNTSRSDGARAVGVTIRNQNELAIIGQYTSGVGWQGYPSHLQHANNTLQDIFISKLGTTNGAPLFLDSLSSSYGYDESPTAIAADKRGNVYIGGQFAADLRVAGDTLQNIGGETDFFVAKYGCNCAPTIANYTYVVNNHTVNYTYTGPMPVDSLVWHFGDASSTTTTGTTTSHSYAGGSFNVCVTAYTPCDSNTYCQQVQVAVGVEEMTVNSMQVNVWPNPMNEDDLSLSLSKGEKTNVAGAYTVSFCDAAGRVLINTTLSESSPTTIHIPGLARGIYFVTVSDPASGMKITRKVVRE